jgi:NNP family nitrate/nitrite transporter-like MFS transporter
MVFLILFSLTVQMAEGATFAVVPFINKKAIGSISGIVGAGGNVGAFLAALFLKSKSAVAETTAMQANSTLGEEAMKTAQTLAAASAVSSGYFIIGGFVVLSAIAALAIKFATADETVAEPELKTKMALSTGDK